MKNFRVIHVTADVDFKDTSNTKIYPTNGTPMGASEAAVPKRLHQPLASGQVGTPVPTSSPAATKATEASHQKLKIT